MIILDFKSHQRIIGEKCALEYFRAVRQRFGAPAEGHMLLNREIQLCSCALFAHELNEKKKIFRDESIPCSEA